MFIYLLGLVGVGWGGGGLKEGGRGRWFGVGVGIKKGVGSKAVFVVFRDWRICEREDVRKG